MKKNKSLLKTIALAIAGTALLEYAIVVITGDKESCFLHNTLWGNILLMAGRIATFYFLSTVLYHLSLPVRATLKDRILEKQELEDAQELAQERFWAEQGERALKTSEVLH